jgi:hypothetical protein
MVAQLPPEVVGVAAGVLIYSLICLASGFFLLWLVWVHDERKSYVSMLACLMCLHTAASIAQQIHTIVRWRDIKTEQYANLVANVGNPELNITGGSTGLDLVLFYIRTSFVYRDEPTRSDHRRILRLQRRVAARLLLVRRPLASLDRRLTWNQGHRAGQQHLPAAHHQDVSPPRQPLRQGFFHHTPRRTDDPAPLQQCA